MGDDQKWVATDQSRAGASREARRTDWRLWLRSRARRRPGMSLRYEPPATRAEVLDRLVELPVSLWTYGWDEPSVRHLGPMAQDFATAFGLGDTDREIFLLGRDRGVHGRDPGAAGAGRGPRSGDRRAEIRLSARRLVRRWPR